MDLAKLPSQTGLEPEQDVDSLSRTKQEPTRPVGRCTGPVNELPSQTGPQQEPEAASLSRTEQESNRPGSEPRAQKGSEPDRTSLSWAELGSLTHCRPGQEPTHHDDQASN